MPQPPADRLALLYRLSQTFNSSLDLTTVLNHVMDEVIAATRAERGFLMLREGDGQLVFRVARGMEQRTIESPAFQISRGLVERVAHEGQPLLTSDAQTDVWLGGRASVVGLGLRSVLCVPLLLKGAIIGVIYVDNRLQAGIFTPDDLELLGAISSNAAIAIENARLYQVAVEKGRLERELQVAREVQLSLIPRRLPKIAGWEFAAYWQPAREVSGDFYDFILADLSRFGVVIADVSDKGMGAALFMALTRSIVRASAAASILPDKCITQANRLICADAANGMFVTLFYAQFDPDAGACEFVNAGHNPPLLYDSRQNELVELTRTGIALGIDDSLQFKQGAVRLGPGDSVLLYTDGVTEATNAEDQEFGVERLRRIVEANGRSPAPTTVRAIQESLREFVGPAPQQDDITVVAIKRI
jgi:sigma-B regulation protein RsbU (phosphoserine phosphatase)